MPPDTTVSGPITSFTITRGNSPIDNNGSISMVLGREETFNVLLEPAGVSGLVSWNSSSDIAVVTPAGRSASVRTIITNGNAVITVTAINDYMQTPLTMQFSIEVTKPQEGVVFYTDFGAKGDGITCDFAAIIAAHEYANEHSLKVFPGRSETGTFFIGSVPLGVTPRPAIIKTDTDWTGANFIIDDTLVPINTSGGWTRWHQSWIFEVHSRQEEINLLSYFLPFKEGAKNLPFITPQRLPTRSVVVAEDDQTMRFIRTGWDVANSGTAQTDVFIVDRNGNVDPTTPILWDFNNASFLTAYPIDEEVLTIRGGTFTTRANRGINTIHHYMHRGILVRRSNTVIDGILHYVTDEPADDDSRSSWAYRGFINVQRCAFVTIKNSGLSGRKLYGINTDVSLGSYDLAAERMVHLTVRNSWQLNCIDDTSLWGIMLSDFVKNIKFDNVRFSRFDAHMGVHNATILNSTLGHQAVQIIGSGLLLVENTTIRSNLNYIAFRWDYGSTWNGDVIIRNGIWQPPGQISHSATIFNLNNDGQHWYGYETFMPRTIIIDGLKIEDAGSNARQGVFLFHPVNYNPGAPHAINLTERVYISGFSSASGHTWRLPANLINQSTGESIITVIDGLPEN